MVEASVIKILRVYDKVTYLNPLKSTIYEFVKIIFVFINYILFYQTLYIRQIA
jgi:hypothetical protein